MYTVHVGGNKVQRNPSASCYPSMYIMCLFIYFCREHWLRLSNSHPWFMQLYVEGLSVLLSDDVCTALMWGRLALFTSARLGGLSIAFVLGLYIEVHYAYVWGLTAYMRTRVERQRTAITTCNLDGRKCFLIWLLSLLLSKSLFFHGCGCYL